MEAYVYKSRKKPEIYLFLRKEADFSAVPAALMQNFGVPELVLRVELTPGRKLARSDAAEVMQRLAADGYYLQLPPQQPGLNPGKELG